MSIVYISIGSNLGDREKNCSRSIELLEKNGIVVRQRSSLYETIPWGVREQPLFLNMVIEAETELKPQELLEVLKNVEIEVGREKSSRWGPRSIDLDILLYDDITLDEETLTIPHPYLHERDFVLIPLCEIAPDIKHPLLQSTMRELLQTLINKSA
jgi:dihydroneopterin aldolase/2-amino-4-hydroxy-6-hydroxymethyldihydropteridine diphosphokinase